MSQRLTQAVVAFRTGRQRKGRRFNYGLSATGLSADGRTLALTLTFRSGHRYCCLEPSCHFGLHHRTQWERLRACLGERGMVLGAPARIILHCVWERGALFAKDPGVAAPEYIPLEQAAEEDLVSEEAEAAE